MTLVAMSFPPKRNPVGPQKLWRDMAHKLSDTIQKAAAEAAASEGAGSFREGNLMKTFLRNNARVRYPLASYTLEHSYPFCSPAAWISPQNAEMDRLLCTFAPLTRAAPTTVAATAAAASDATTSKGAKEGNMDNFLFSNHIELIPVYLWAQYERYNRHPFIRSNRLCLQVFA